MPTLADTAWLSAHLGRSDIRVVDVCDSLEVHGRGHLPGAVHVSVRTDLADSTRGMLGMVPTRGQFQTLMRRLGLRNSDVVVFYDNRSGVLAARAFWIFKLYGHHAVLILNGGLRKWAAEGRLLVTTTTEIRPSEYRAAAPNGGINVTVDEIAANRSAWVLLDCRTAAEYADGHIPGALHVDWALAMRPDETFRDSDELRALYGCLTASQSRTVVTYCRTGVRSAHTWFVLEHLLRYPAVRNYDGSWEEWRRRGLPIEW